MTVGELKVLVDQANSINPNMGVSVKKEAMENDVISADQVSQTLDSVKAGSKNIIQSVVGKLVLNI